jgi:Tfp pilus assembly protein PilV
MTKNTKKGFSLVETIVAAAIIISVVTAGAGAFQLYLRISRESNERTQAALLTEEAAEALRFYRDMSWDEKIDTLNIGTTYYLYWSDVSYSVSLSPITVNNAFTVSFVMNTVQRDDLSKDIVSSGGTVDPDTRSVTITISSTGSPPKELLVSNMLLHNIFQN